MTTDWSLYGVLAKADWRPVDAPTITNKITIKHGGREIVIPLPDDAEVLELQAERDRLGNECDRLVIEWFDEVKKVEAKLRQYEPPPKCSGCGHDLGIEWVCEGLDDPECAGHDG